jgi:meso-butanediol dehydrogenase/(S,S)-butanediol dehydrogenase/diacetyl reductase
MIKKMKGAVVNISSVCGLAGDYDFFAYNASKGAIVNMTRSLALDFAAYNIRVNSVAPAQIRTPMFFKGGERMGGIDIMDAGAKDAYPLGRAGEPEEIAACVLFLASDYASFVTGHNLAADGGVLAHNGNQHQWDRIIKEVKAARA